MNQTQLIIYDNASGIVQYEVDLYDNEPIQLTKQIFDVENPDERVADFTRTIKIPATHNNNKIFGHFFDLNRFTMNESEINFNSDFNVTLKANAYLYANGALQSRGYIQLTNIVKLPDESTEYEIVFIGEVKNIFSDLGEKVLSELDMSEYDHTLNYNTVVNSWNHTYVSGYVYPLIDYGFASSQTQFRIENLYAATFLKTVVDKIFSEAGYKYESSFFDSDRFKAMIIPYNGTNNVLTEFEVSRGTGGFDVSSIQTTTSYPSGIPSVATSGFERIAINRAVDTTPPGYNVSTYEYVVPVGYVTNAVYYEVVLDYQFTPSSYVSPVDVQFKAYVVHTDSSNNLKNLQSLQTTVPVLSSSPFLFSLTTTSKLIFKNVLPTDKIYLMIQEPKDASTGLGYAGTLVLQTGSGVFMSPVTGANFEGALIKISNTLSKDVKQSDLLVWLIKMFNLYIESDPYDDRKLIIEPRNEYYVSGFVDWTNKVDYLKDIVIKPVDLSKYGEYLFQYAEDDDVYNKTYQLTSEYSYGFRRFDVLNQFTEETKEVSVGVAPTPLSRWTLNNLPITVIQYVDNNNQRQAKIGKLRVLMYKKYTLSGTPTPWQFITTQFGTQNIVDYPYAGHLDDIFDPNFDLNWGVPDVLYYNATLYTNANLFNEYWIDYIRSIIDPDSKVVEMYIKMNEVDILNLSFRNRYLIDRQYYILQSVEYDLMSEDTYKCVFLKLSSKYSFQTSQSNVNGGIGDFQQGDGMFLGNGERKPLFEQQAIPNNNSYDTQRNYHTANGYVIGSQNTIQAQGYFVGDGNLVLADRATVVNSDNARVIHENVTLINTDGLASTLPDETYIQGVQFPFCKRVILTEAQIDALHTTRIELVPDASGFIVEYVDAYAVNRFNTTAYAGHKIFIANTSGGEDVAEFAATFPSASETCMQKAKAIDQPLFTEGGLELYASNNLSGGNGEFEFVVQYRLIKI